MVYQWKGEAIERPHHFLFYTWRSILQSIKPCCGGDLRVPPCSIHPPHFSVAAGRCELPGQLWGRFRYLPSFSLVCEPFSDLLDHFYSCIKLSPFHSIPHATPLFTCMCICLKVKYIVERRYPGSSLHPRKFFQAPVICFQKFTSFL